MSTFDEAQVRRIANALWTASPHSSASVMVGSGFSRNATPKSPQSRPFPLWWELTDQMAAQLYGDSRPRTPPDALRLAEMFETAFGTSALDDLLMRSIPDGEHEPGELHRLLVDLPWADVFTTNYDTLLERTLSTRRYGVIRTAAELPLNSKPRIIKLNGSFPSTRPFIITHEHFRRYPRDFAALVNTAQQAMLETTFVLIGFSGDDPNFLQWAGWVRDNLGSAAPRLYLCGVLDLTPATQRQYESMRVVPIDLGAVFPLTDWPDKDDRHKKATTWLLDSLYRLRPVPWNEWPKEPTPPKDERSDGSPAPLVTRVSRPEQLSGSMFSSKVSKGGARTDATAHLPQFKMMLTYTRYVREHYPGWVVCPTSHRIDLEHALPMSLFYRDTEMGILCLKQLSGVDRLEALFEIGWWIAQRRCGLTPPLLQLMQESLDSVCPFPRQLTPPAGTLVPARNDPTDWKVVGEKWVELAFLLVADAWEMQEEAEWKRWMDRLEKIVPQKPEWEAHWYAEQCNWHLMLLDETKAREFLSRWPKDQRLPWWEGRRAAFLGELGSVDEALEVCEASLSAIKVWQGSTTSERSTLSQEGWLVLLNSNLKLSSDCRDWESVSERLRELSRYQCDPTLELERSETELAKDSPKRFGDAMILVRMQREVPFAPYLPGVVPWGAQGLKDSVYEIWSVDPWLATSLLLRGDVDNRKFEKFFSRDRMAFLTHDQVLNLFERLLAALERAHAQETLRPSSGKKNNTWGLSGHILDKGIELLSRLAMRLTDDALNRVFQFACALYRSPALHERRGLYSSLSSLFKETMHSATDEQLTQWLPQLMSLPIPGTSDFPLPDSALGWPEPLDFAVSREPKLNQLFKEEQTTQATIATLIAIVADGVPAARATAATRLDMLHRQKMLQPSQIRALEAALWSKRKPKGLPDETRFLLSAFLSLPAPDDADVPSLAKAALLDPENRLLHRPQDYANQITGCTADIMRLEHDSRPTIVLSADEFGKLLKQVEGCIEREVGSVRRGGAPPLPPTHPNARFGSELAIPNPPRYSNWQGLPFFINIVARVILPGLAEASAEQQSHALNLLERMDSAGFPPISALPVTLLFRPDDADSVALRLAQGLISPQKVQVLQACQGLVYWVLLAKRGRIPPPKEILITQFCTLVGSLRHPRLDNLLQAVSEIASETPQFLTPDQTQMLHWALEGLEDGTRLIEPPADRWVIKEEPLIEAEVRPSLHFEAARLAWALYRNAEQSGATPAPVLVRWKAASLESPLPEVRRLWVNQAP